MDGRQEMRCILRAQTGDREALETLLKSVQEPLYRYIRRLTGESSVSQDILQDVFIRIYKRLGWLREPELFRAWAYRIASREVYSHLRREHNWSDQIRDESFLETIPAPSEREISEWTQHLPELMEGVSPASRVVIGLHYSREMTIEEIATELGIPAGTVKSRLAYGLANLRRQFQKLQGRS